jgi:hypothetical protein
MLQQKYTAHVVAGLELVQKQKLHLTDQGIFAVLLLIGRSGFSQSPTRAKYNENRNPATPSPAALGPNGSPMCCRHERVVDPW